MLCAVPSAVKDQFGFAEPCHLWPCLRRWHGFGNSLKKFNCFEKVKGGNRPGTENKRKERLKALQNARKGVSVGDIANTRFLFCMGEKKQRGIALKSKRSFLKGSLLVLIPVSYLGLYCSKSVATASGRHTKSIFICFEAIRLIKNLFMNDLCGSVGNSNCVWILLQK